MPLMDLEQVDLGMDEYWKLHPAKAQFHRLGPTSRWFRPKGEVMKGKRFHFKAFVTPMSNVRTSDFATASAYNHEFPAGRQIIYEELSYDREDLTMFEGTLEINDLAETVTTDQKHAVYNLVTKMFGEANSDFGHKFNLAIHQSSACEMGTVAAKYASTGATYSQAAYAFIQVTDQQIGKFLPGEVLDIGSVSDITILDVIPGQDGPWSSAARVANIGPGLVIAASTTTGNLDSVTAADAIRRSGETTSDGMHGFADWFGGGTNVYTDEGGTAIDRDARGNAWSIPIIETIAAAGSEEEIDLDAHFGRLADVWPQAVNWGRGARARETPEDDTLLPGALLAIGPVDLINAIMLEGEDSARFTMTIDLQPDQRTKLFAHVGFDGIVWHTATLPPIAFQADAAAAKFKFRIIDPQSWGFINLTAGAGMYGIEWLRNGMGGGNRWQRVQGTNGRPTHQLTAGAYAAALMYCDQPRANAEIGGVKTYR